MQTLTDFTRKVMTASLLLVFVVAGANGQTWDETTDGGGDAGELIGTAQGINVNGSLTTITGDISTNDDIDMYRIIVTTGSLFSASSVGVTTFDTIISLVDETGLAIYLNDDDAGCGGCFQSTLPAGDVNSPSTNGDVYYLIVHGYDRHPQTVNGDPIFTYDGLGDYTLVHGPSGTPGPVASYQPSGGKSGAYTISLTSAEGDPTLPVELASFSAVSNGNDVVLQWSTLSETNNLGFDIQVKGTNDGDFSTIGFIDGSGTSAEATDYSFTASDLDYGVQTFRLRQVDLDGSFRYSSDIEVSVELPTEYVMEQAYPNPFNPRATFDFAVQDQQTVRASLYNMIGQEVAELFNGLVEANSMQQIGIEARNLPSGVYIVRLAGENFNATQTISLMK
ncbi:MAG: T9SS type A sorting domain-containing protein [Rhodothermales bacterium]|nr:T9SS type A sorting domain-containing protein [Rhodothermales bacterium]